MASPPNDVQAKRVSSTANAPKSLSSVRKEHPSNTSFRGEAKRSLSTDTIKKAPIRSNKFSDNDRRESGDKSSSSKKRRYSSDELSEFDEAHVSKNYSSIIQQMFGYNRSRYQDVASDDSSDMEVNYRDLEREEKRSLRIGKKEDLEEEQRELEKERRKMMRKK